MSVINGVSYVPILQRRGPGEGGKGCELRFSV
jgi:hypothetical protein